MDGCIYAMSISAIILNESNEAVWRAVRDRWPDGRHYILTDRVAFVAPEGITLTQDVADHVGMSGDVLGIVIEFDKYHGFNHSGLWEWLDKVS